MSTLTYTARRLVVRAFETRSLPSLVLAFFTAIATACGGGKDAPTSPTSPDGNATIVGSYSLQQVDGRGLPVTIFDDDVETEDGRVVRLKVAVASGSFDIDDNDDNAGSGVRAAASRSARRALA